MWHEAWYREKGKGESLARQGWLYYEEIRMSRPRERTSSAILRERHRPRCSFIGLIFFGSQLLSTWPLLLYRNLIYCNQAPTKGVRNQRLLLPNGTAPNVRTRSKVVIRSWLKILQSNIFCARQSFCAAWLLFTTWGEAISVKDWSHKGTIWMIWRRSILPLRRPFAHLVQTFSRFQFCKK